MVDRKNKLKIDDKRTKLSYQTTLNIKDPQKEQASFLNGKTNLKEDNELWITIGKLLEYTGDEASKHYTKWLEINNQLYSNEESQNILQDIKENPEK